MPALLLELAPALLFSLTLMLVMLDFLYQASYPIHGVKPLVVTGPTWGDIIKAVERPLQAARGWLDGGLWTVIRAVWSWEDSHQQFLNAIGVHIESTHQALGSITYGRIPAARAAAHQESQQVYHDSLDYAASGDQAVTRHADKVGQDANAYTRQVGAAVDAHAVQLTAGAETYSRQLSAQDQAFTQAVGKAAQLYAQQLAAQGLQYTDQVAGQLQQFTRAVGQAATDYTDGVARTLEGVIESGRAADQAWAGNAITSQVGPLAAGLAVTQAAVQELENSDCMKFCNPLGNLGAALDAIDLALLLALGAEAFRDPGGLAKSLDGILSPLVADAEGTFAAIFGVKL